MAAQSKSTRNLLIIFALTLALGIGGAVMMRVLVQEDVSQLVMIGALVVLLGVATVINVFYFRAIDELAQRIHEKAFFWGGMTGAVVAIAIALPSHKLSAFTLPPLEAMAKSETQAFGLGIMFMTLLIVVGTFFVWSALWLKQRQA